ncbi:MAG: phosphomethylpyrimidine kinase, partial [Lachnospiraceae bacterium]|nr:phosphomethylpyrimidine kinase [Lachnospiraceae bacterium]
MDTQKKIAVINDLSGYGRCSLTVAMPILSVMRHQC